MRIAFAGTPEFAKCHLEMLMASHHEIVAVFTQPDRPAGRGRKLQQSAVKVLANTAQLPCYQPQRLDETAQKQLEAWELDSFVVVAYGLILPKALLATPKYGCINVHASLLPRWRGAAPIPRAIEAGDKESGITIMQMAAGLDSGDILLQQRCAIAPDETSASLYEKLTTLGPKVLLTALDQWEQLPPVKQDASQVCYAHKIHKKESKVNWQATAQQIERQVRAFNPWPVATTWLQDQAIRIWQAEALSARHDAAPGTILNLDSGGLDIAAGEGIVRITAMQLPGGKVLPVAAILNAKRSLFERQQFAVN